MRFSFSLLLIAVYFVIGQAQPSLILSDTTILSGSTATIRTSTIDFTDITKVQFSINWNPAELDFIGISDINTTALNLSIENIDTSDVNNGNLVFLWEGVTGVTLADNTSFFAMEFEAILTASGNADVTFSNTPAEIIFNRTALGDINIHEDALVQNGVVNIVGDDVNCRLRDSLALVALWNTTHENGPWTNEWDLSMSVETWFGITLNETGCLTELNLSNNKLTGNFPSIELDSLLTLDLSLNELNGFSEESNMPSLQDLFLHLNELTFEDLIPIRDIAGNTFSYTPQQNILIDTIIFANVGEGVNIELNIDSGITDNRYSWFQNDESVQGTSNSNLSFVNIQFSQAGTYNVEITNPNIPDLVLNGGAIEVVVDFSNEPCPDLENFTPPSFVYDLESCINGMLPVEVGNLTFPSLTSCPEGSSLLFSVNGSSYTTNNWSNISPPRILNGTYETWCACNSDTSIISDIVSIEICPTIDSSCREQDSLALVALYNSTDGANWTNTWDLSMPIDSWFGVTLNEEGCIICLNLSGINDCGSSSLDGNNLIGSIPIELSQLSNLTMLDLGNNELSGSIPMEFNQLNNLTRLILRGNNLLGIIPKELSQLNNLTILSLGDNGLSGTIPIELSQLDNLTTLNLSNNKLSGTIPIELGQLDNLTIFDLGSNELNGTIPIEISQLTNLTFLILAFNKLNGTIPNEIGLLNNLTRLDLGNNEFSGSIPMEIGQLNNLTYLDLGNNEVSGTIPIELSQLSNLTFLGLRYSALSGTIPKEFSRLTNLKHLDLRNNKLSGTIPNEIGLLNNLTRLELGNNEFSRTIPNEIGLLNNLTYLDLRNNKLIGNIPNELRLLQNLTWLNISFNQISGEIPVELGQLQNLEEIDLSFNQFKGEVSQVFGTLINLKELNLENNLFVGELSKDLVNLIQLEKLFIARNNFLGPIPQELTALTNLQELTLQNNNFTYEDFTIFSDVPNLTVAPQKLFYRDTTYIGVVNNPLEINLAIDENVNNNEYEWNKNEILWAPDGVNNPNSNRLIFPSIQPADAGTYNAIVTNPDFPGAVLESFPINIQVCNSEQDSIQLVLLFNSTNGESWTNKENWLSDQPIDTWYGVSTNEFGCVGAMDLSNNNLTGTLPTLNFNTLDTLILANNELSNTIPDLQLPLARVLDLSFNQLSGAIPSSIGGLINLRVLNLSNNNLTNTIPPDIGDLCDLEELRLNNNMLDGLLPIEIIQLHNLQQGRVDFSDNMIEILVDQHAFLCPFGDSILMSNPGFDRFLSICNVKCLGDEWEMPENFPWIADTLSTLVCPDNTCQYSYTQSGYVSIRGIEVIYTRNVCYTRLDPAEFVEIVNFYDCGGNLLEMVTYTQAEYIALFQAIPQTEFEQLAFNIRENCGQQTRASFTTSIEEVEVTDKVVSKTTGIIPLEVFPNPPNDAIHFYQKEDMDLSQIRCTNLWGQSIPVTLTSNRAINTLIFDNQPAGLYLLSIEGAERVYLTKFIKF